MQEFLFSVLNHIGCAIPFRIYGYTIPTLWSKLITRFFLTVAENFIFLLCIFITHVLGILPIFRIQHPSVFSGMGNENSSIPSDATTPTSEWQSVQSFGSKRRSSVSSTRIPTPVEPPEPDLSHLSEDEIAQIRAVLDRAKEMQHEEHIRIRQLEEDYTSCAAAVEQRALALDLDQDLLDGPPLCPICMKNELRLDETGLRLGQNVCVDCEMLTCAKCGAFKGSLTTKLQEWVCEVCQKRRALVLSTGLWYPGYEPTADIPLSRQIETRLEEIKSTEGRAPLGRSASLGDVDDKPKRDPLKRQSSLPLPAVSKSFTDKLMLPITETSESKESSKVSLVSPSLGECTTTSTGKSRIRAITNTLHSDSENSDMMSDVDMEDVSNLYLYGDGISPDEGSDDYSMMSIGSSENSGSLQRKHRPKYLNISRSHSATSSDDENTDSGISPENDGRLAPLAIMNEHVVAQAASAFAEEMEDFKTEASDDSWKDIFDKSDSEFPDDLKMHKSPNGPVSPSWREGLDSPPFSPPRRDSYPGKRRASSPVSPKDKLHFTYTDMSPPSRQLSLDELYGDGHAHAAHDISYSGVNLAQKPSPMSPDEINNSILTTSGEHLFFEKPKDKRQHENLTLEPDVIPHVIAEQSGIMDLATFAASVASSTANLTQMTVSPTNLMVHATQDRDEISPESQDSIDSASSTSPVSPGYYDNAPSADEQEDVELADPNAKAIDYQGTKRQKARPPSTDWSPVIDLSPILDVSPSIEEAEQEDMLEKQEEERRRRESQEEEEEDDEDQNRHVFEPLGDDEVHAFIGLKRYHRVENICELLNNNNIDNNTDDILLEKHDEDKATNEFDLAIGPKPNKQIAITEVPFSCVSETQTSVSDSVVTKTSDMGIISSVVSVIRNIPKPELLKSQESNIKEKPKVDDKNVEISDKVKPVVTPRTRRKLPEPTAEMIAAHTVIKSQTPSPVPKKPARAVQGNLVPKSACYSVIEVPCALERSSSLDTPTKKSTYTPRSSSLDTPERKSVATSPKLTDSVKEQLQKQDSEERRRKAKDLKAKPNPILIKHIEAEEQTMSPQYKVLDSPPSPESRSSLKRDYSDSTSVSPSSSPDREVYPYPSPVTPPDSDSSPPKPHSPSSPGTDFDDESSLDLKHISKVNASKKEIISVTADAKVKDKIKRFEQTSSASSHEPKKIRRKLPPIPAGEEPITTQKPRDKNSTQRKANHHHLRADIRKKRASYGTPSSTSDESMNEDDFEVAMLTYADRHMNDLDKPSVVDRRNGNYLQSEIPETKPSKNVKQMLNEEVKANIPPIETVITTEKTMANVERNVDQFIKDKDEADLIIDSLINIYGAPITRAMKSLKKRLQEELRRVTDGRRKRIEELEEIRALQLQIGELKLSTEYAKAQLKRNLQNKPKQVPDNKNKKRGPPPVPAPRSSPQVIARRSRHKRQSSDPMVAKFSPIKEDKDIEADLQIKVKDTLEPPQIKYTTDDSSQSGLSDNDSIRSEPVLNSRYKKIKPSAYTKMFYPGNGKESVVEQVSPAKQLEPSAKSKSQSESQLFPARKTSPAAVLYSDDDEDRRFRDQKKQQLQDEIRKRKRHLEETAKLKTELFNLSRTGHVMAHSFDDIPKKSNYIYPPTRPIPTGIIKPLDDEERVENDDVMDSSQEEIKDDWDNFQQQANYSSTEYLAHKQEAAMLQRLEEFSYSSPYLYSSNINDPHAFKPTKQKVDFFCSPTKDSYMSSSVTLPELHTTRTDLEYKENHVTYSDTEASPPSDSTPAMPLLNDVMTRTRKIIHDIGTGSRPASAEYSFGGVDELLNAMHRVESDNSVDADEPIMKHMTEGGVTILKQKERKKQPPPPRPKRYEFPTKRILLTRDPKDRSVKGNGIGMKIVGGTPVAGSTDVGAFVTTIYPGGVAEQLHGELEEGDQVIEWNGIELTAKSYEEVQNIVSAPNGEIELVIRPGPRTQPKAVASRDMSDHTYENVQYLQQDKPPPYDKAVKQSYAVDPKQLAAQLQGIQEADSPAGSQSSSQQEFLTPSLSSQCSSPHSDPTSSSSDRQRQGSISDAIDKAFEHHKESYLPSVDEQISPENNSSNSSEPKIINEVKPVEKIKNVDTNKLSPKKNSVMEKKTVSPIRPLFKDNKFGEIQLQLSHDDYDNTLNIHVIQACNLVPKDLNGSSDPFAKLYLLPGRCPENKRRTKHISHTLNPEWHQTVMFQDIHREELQYKTLEITVWDYDRFKTNDFLGEVVIDLSVPGFLDNMPHWYPLKEHDPTTGVELPKPTVLPPIARSETSIQARSESPNVQIHSTSSPMSQRRKRVVHGEAGARGMGRRRRSFGTLTDVDRLTTSDTLEVSSTHSSPLLRHKPRDNMHIQSSEHAPEV